MNENSQPCVMQVEKEDEDNELSESWSSTQIKVIKHRHTWTINNFSFCGKKSGESIFSPTFSLGMGNDKSQWCLHLYPNGRTMDHCDYISLYLKLIDFHMSEIQIKYGLGIMNACGQNIISSKDQLRSFSNERMWGYDKFLLIEELFSEDNEYLLNDRVTISCKMVATLGSENISGTLTSLPSGLTMNFAFLLGSNVLSDVTLCADGSDFPAHKVILAAQSPVFRAMFNSNMKENQNNRVEITDIDKLVLCEMLRYMYTGKIHELEAMAPHLLCAAEKYAMDDLKVICENAMFKSLSLDNVAETFILSDRFRTTNLKTRVKEFIAAHASILINKPEFQSILRTHPDLGIEAYCALNFN